MKNKNPRIGSTFESFLDEEGILDDCTSAARTRPATHPGEILAGELEETGVSPTELARQIDVPPNRISQIINGKRSITGDTALRLGHWFGTSPTFWLNLQAAYDLRAAAAMTDEELEAIIVADEALENRRYFGLNAEQWKVFQTTLNAPLRSLPRLKELMRKRGIFN